LFKKKISVENDGENAANAKREQKGG